jgi:hypothetical protein
MSTGCSQELALLDKASQLLAEANSLEEIKSFHDKVDGLQTYIRDAKLGLTYLNQAAEAKLRAERKAGTALHSMHLRGGNRRSKLMPLTLRLKLEDLGVSRQESMRWQRVAAVPEREFCDYFRLANELGEEVTLAGLLRFAARNAVCSTSSSELPRCQVIRPCDGTQRPETDRVLFAEVGHDLGLIWNVLERLCEQPELPFEVWQRRMVGRYMHDISDIFRKLKLNDPLKWHELSALIWIHANAGWTT